MKNAMTKRLAALGATAVIAASGGFLVAPWEGKSNSAYLDIVGVPTICYGQTRGVKMGDRKTDAECEMDLVKGLTEYNAAMRKHVKVSLSEHEEAAYTSFIWNLGETNWRTSTLLKKLNAGDRQGACNELLRWDKAGGKVVKGLTNRRVDEYKACMGNNADLNKAIAMLSLENAEKVDIEVGESPVTVEIPENPTVIVHDLPPQVSAEEVKPSFWQRLMNLFR